MHLRKSALLLASFYVVQVNPLPPTLILGGVITALYGGIVTIVNVTDANQDGCVTAAEARAAPGRAVTFVLDRLAKCGWSPDAQLRGAERTGGGDAAERNSGGSERGEVVSLAPRPTPRPSPGPAPRPTPRPTSGPLSLPTDNNAPGPTSSSTTTTTNFWGAATVAAIRAEPQEARAGMEWVDDFEYFANGMTINNEGDAEPVEPDPDEDPFYSKICTPLSEFEDPDVWWWDNRNQLDGTGAPYDYYNSIDKLFGVCIPAGATYKIPDALVDALARPCTVCNNPAFWAGVIDGDGCISASLKEMTASGLQQIKLDISIRGKLDDLAPLMMAAYASKAMGVSAIIYPQKLTVGANRGKPAMHVGAKGGGAEAIAFLETFAPFLVKKRAQAQAVLDAYESARLGSGGGPPPQHLYPAINAARLELHEVVSTENHRTRDRAYYQSIIDNFSAPAFMGWMSGIWITDGTCYVGKDRRRSIEIRQSNKPLLEALNARVLREYGITAKAMSPDRTDLSINDAFRSHWRSRSVATDFAAFGRALAEPFEVSMRKGQRLAIVTADVPGDHAYTIYRELVDAPHTKVLAIDDVQYWLSSSKTLVLREFHVTNVDETASLVRLNEALPKGTSFVDPDDGSEWIILEVGMHQAFSGPVVFYHPSDKATCLTTPPEQAVWRVAEWAPRADWGAPKPSQRYAPVVDLAVLEDAATAFCRATLVPDLDAKVHVETVRLAFAEALPGQGTELYDRLQDYRTKESLTFKAAFEAVVGTAWTFRYHGKQSPGVEDYRFEVPAARPEDEEMANEDSFEEVSEDEVPEGVPFCEYSPVIEVWSWVLRSPLAPPPKPLRPPFATSSHDAPRS